MVFYEESPAVKKTKPTKRTPKVKKNPTDDVIDPNPPELASPPPPVLPNESSPTSNQNDMDIDGLENAALEFQSTEETQKVGINALDGVIDPDGPTTESPPTPVVLVETSPHADPKVIDIDNIQNTALSDPHATIEDTQTSPRDVHPPDLGLDDHVNEGLPQTPPHGSQPPSQQNQSSDKNTSKDVDFPSQPSSAAFPDDKYPDVTAGPVFSLGHDDASYILDNACTREMIEFHNSNWPIVTHFYNTVGEDPDFVPCVHLLQCNHNVSFNSGVVSEIVFNYSKSQAERLVENKHMPNADHDFKSFLALSASSDEHPLEDLTQLVPLVGTPDDASVIVSTRPKSFHSNWGSKYLAKWRTLLKTNSFTDEGKMAWARECGLESECEALLSSINSTPTKDEKKYKDGEALITYKNRMFYDLLHRHRMPPFRMDNEEGKHRKLAYCCLAIGRFVNPATGIISTNTGFKYKHFAELGIIPKEDNRWPADRTFLDDLEDVLKMKVKCNALHKCSTLEVYYISSPPSDIHCNLVMSALITLSKQISDAKLASNRPHPMDLCAQFVKNLARTITKDSVFLTPNMIHYEKAYPLMVHQSKSQLEAKLKNEEKEPTYDNECSFTKYFENIDSEPVQNFIAWPSEDHYEDNFKTAFSFTSHDDPKHYLTPPFVNSYRSLVIDPSLSTITDGKKSTYKKIDAINTSRLNKLYFAIKVFNYLYASIKRVSLKEAQTVEAKTLLNYIVKYFINNKVSTQTHLLHGAGQLWYQDIIPDKKLYFDTSDSHIIGATVFITGMIDAAFDLPHEHEDSGPTVTLENMPSTPQKQDSPRKRNSVDSKSDATSKRNKRLDSIVRKIKHQLNTLAAAFSAMNDTLNFSISDIYFNLSKSLIFDCLSDNWTQFID